jgi:hypothetical protein
MTDGHLTHIPCTLPLLLDSTHRMKKLAWKTKHIFIPVNSLLIAISGLETSLLGNIR